MLNMLIHYKNHQIILFVALKFEIDDSYNVVDVEFKLLSDVIKINLILKFCWYCI